MEFYKKFSKFFHKLEYHKKLKFSISSIFLHISETVVVNYKIFLKIVLLDHFGLSENIFKMGLATKGIGPR